MIIAFYGPLISIHFDAKPDKHYFDNTFRPILITGDDGNKYNVIPSDQFK